MSRPEQICPNETPGYRRELKKQAKRLARRKAKRLLDDAPKKHAFRGYSK